MRKDTQAVLLLLVGGTLLKISLAGTYVRYVKPGLLPLLLIAAAVLIAVAVVTLWQVIRVPLRAQAGGRHEGFRVDRLSRSNRHGTDLDDVDRGHDDDEGDDDGHGHGEPRVGWLLLAPALALLLFAPPALGSFQASRNGTALSTQKNSDFPPLPEGDPVRISMLDYAARAVFDEGRSLTGRQIKLTGFIISGPNGEAYLARLIVSCCAADARPVKVGLTGDLPATLVADAWIEIIGAYTDRADSDPVNSEKIPYIQVISARTITAPDLQYES